MKIRWFKKLSREARHPSVEDLLLYLDGEAETKHAGEIKEHLESCWACRARREKIERSINDLVEFAAVAALRPTEPRPQARDRFLFALKILAEDRGQAPLFGQKIGQRIGKLLDGARERASFLPALDSAWMTRLSVGLLTLCLLAVAFVFLSREQTVTAHELIDRVTKAEARAFRERRQPVIYQKINARRITPNMGPNIGEDAKAVTLEVWRDIGNQRMQQRVASEGQALFTELEQIFRANQFDSQRPLSAAAFAEWRKSIETKSESVAASSDDWKLTTIAEPPYAVNAITEASLVVRKSDWHAVALHLNVRGENEIRAYELSETAHEVLPAQALAVFVEASPAPASQPEASPVPVARPAAATPLPAPKPALTEAALDEAEIAARYALHQMQADLGEEVTLTRTNEGLRIEAVVEQAERRRELLQALAAVAAQPGIAVKIQTAEEAANRESSKPRRATVVSEAAAENRTIPLHKEVRRMLASRNLTEAQLDAEASRFAGRVLTRSRQTALHAWAMRGLAARFSARQWNRLGADARTKWLTMVQRHAESFQRGHETLGQELALVLPGLAAAPALAEVELADEAALLRALERLAARASADHDAIQTAFTISNEPGAAVTLRTAQFQQSFQQARLLAVAIQRAAERLKP